MLDIICSTTRVTLPSLNSPSTAQRMTIAISAAIIDLMPSKDAEDASRSPIKRGTPQAQCDPVASVVRIR
jgi:hypothetical protein